MAGTAEPQKKGMHLGAGSSDQRLGDPPRSAVRWLPQQLPQVPVGWPATALPALWPALPAPPGPGIGSVLQLHPCTALKRRRAFPIPPCTALGCSTLLVARCTALERPALPVPSCTASPHVKPRPCTGWQYPLQPRPAQVCVLHKTRPCTACTASLHVLHRKLRVRAAACVLVASTEHHMAERRNCTAGVPPHGLPRSVAREMRRWECTCVQTATCCLTLQDVTKGCKQFVVRVFG